MTLGTLLARFLEERRASPKNKSVKDDEERCRPLLKYFGTDTPVAAITTGQVAAYRTPAVDDDDQPGAAGTP